MFSPRHLAVAFLLLALPVSVAEAHVKTNEGRWLLTGSTYVPDEEDPFREPPERDQRTDPVSVMWRGGNHDYRIGVVRDHIEEHWTERRIPEDFPPGGGMEHRRDNPACRSAQFIFFRQGNDANVGGWGPSRAYMSTNTHCGDQWHIRMWDTTVHGGFFHDAGNEFVITPIHHEIFTEGGHQTDLSFDDAAYVLWTEMRAHCRIQRWAVHPESDGFRYRPGEPYSGIITKISLRHRKDPGKCNGAFD